MKILYIIPPNITFDDFVSPSENVKVTKYDDKIYGSVITDMPLGVISLSAYINSQLEVDASVIDFNVRLNKIDNFEWLSFKDYFRWVLDEEIASSPPDLIGISALFSTAFQSLIDIGEVVRELESEVFLIAGGNVPTVSYHEIFQHTNVFDAVCHGEGEIPLLELLMAKDMKQHVASSDVWITSDNALNQSEFSFRFLDDLDEVPFDYSIIDVDDYELNPTV